MQITIQTTAIDAKHFLDIVAREQVPFAMSRAVNLMARDIRAQEQPQIGRYLTLRTNWLLKPGAMPIQPSSKKQLPNIHAILGVKDEIAALTAMGGRKEKHNKTMAVPFSNAGQGRGTRAILSPGAGTLTKGKWPSKIVKQGGKGRKRSGGRGGEGTGAPFLMKSKRSGRTFVAQRATPERKPLEILYELLPSVKIDEIWPLIYHAQYFVEVEYDSYFERALNAAITAPRRR